MPHPPHRLADGSADVHADDCARCEEIIDRYGREMWTTFFYIDQIPLADCRRIDAQLEAEDAQEAAKETK